MDARQAFVGVDVAAVLGAEIERLIAEGSPRPGRRDDPVRLLACWQTRIDVLEEALAYLPAETLDGAHAHGRALVRAWTGDGNEETIFDRNPRLERLMMSVVNYLEAAVTAGSIGGRPLRLAPSTADTGAK